MSLRADLRAARTGWRWGHRPLPPASALPHLPPAEPTEFPTGWARTPAARAVRHGIQRYGLRPLVQAEVSLKVAGLDRLADLEAPVLFAANHSSHLDTAVLLSALPEDWRRRTTVAAAADYFFDAWWRAVGSALVFNTFPIDRRSGSLAATPAELLADGWNMVVFPEGTRSRDGWMGRFRNGAAWLAQAHELPVVPVAIRGAYAAMPRGRGWPVPGRPPVHVRFGEPVRPRPGEDVRELARRIRAAVAVLLDEDGSDWYAARLRAARGETPDPSGPAGASWRRVWAASEPPSEPRRRAWQR